jgi:hypothetical protein
MMTNGPMRKVAGIPADQLQELKCSCGCNEFVARQVVFFRYDRLEPKSLALEPGQQFHCNKCGAGVQMTADGRRWHTVSEKPEWEA